MPRRPPVLIIGAGVSGLLLAQHLRKSGIPHLIFERDADPDTRGIGWGLTLHWSLEALRALLPEDLYNRLPEAYVDRLAVENGECSRFPFFDLKTAELKASTPPAPATQRIRVTRDKFRRLLCSGIEVQWSKCFNEYRENDESVTVLFEDGTFVEGCLLVACDGGHSRVRKALFPNHHENQHIPVKVMGLRVHYTPKQIQPLRELDPFFLQGTHSENDTFVYFSILDAPGNSNDETTNNQYACQMCISWPFRPGFFGRTAPTDFPETNEARLALVRQMAETWAEPFRSLVLAVPDDTDVKTVGVADRPPPRDVQGSGRVVLMGDAMHLMAMYRGEGANHAIVDVLDFANLVCPLLLLSDEDESSAAGQQQQRETALRAALDDYEDAVARRSRPGVLASRRACLDAHSWARIGPQSPLLTRRATRLDFDDESLDW